MHPLPQLADDVMIVPYEEDGGIVQGIYMDSFTHYPGIGFVSFEDLRRSRFTLPFLEKVRLRPDLPRNFLCVISPSITEMQALIQAHDGELVGPYVRDTYGSEVETTVVAVLNNIRPIYPLESQNVTVIVAAVSEHLKEREVTL